MAYQFSPASGELEGAAPLVHEPYGYGTELGVIDLKVATGSDLWRNPQ